MIKSTPTTKKLNFFSNYLEAIYMTGNQTLQNKDNRLNRPYYHSPSVFSVLSISKMRYYQQQQQQQIMVLAVF